MMNGKINLLIQKTIFMTKIKQSLLMRLFGIKPKNNDLQLNKLTPTERPFNVREYNQWCRQFNVSSRIHHR